MGTAPTKKTKRDEALKAAGFRPTVDFKTNLAQLDEIEATGKTSGPKPAAKTAEKPQDSWESILSELTKLIENPNIPEALKQRARTLAGKVVVKMGAAAPPAPPACREFSGTSTCGLVAEGAALLSNPGVTDAERLQVREAASSALSRRVRGQKA